MICLLDSNIILIVILDRFKHNHIKTLCLCISETIAFGVASRGIGSGIGVVDKMHEEVANVRNNLKFIRLTI